MFAVRVAGIGDRGTSACQTRAGRLHHGFEWALIVAVGGDVTRDDWVACRFHRGLEAIVGAPCRQRIACAYGSVTTSPSIAGSKDV